MLRLHPYTIVIFITLNAFNRITVRKSHFPTGCIVQKDSPILQIYHIRNHTYVIEQVVETISGRSSLHAHAHVIRKSINNESLLFSYLNYLLIISYRGIRSCTSPFHNEKDVSGAPTTSKIHTIPILHMHAVVVTGLWGAMRTALRMKFSSFWQSGSQGWAWFLLLTLSRHISHLSQISIMAQTFAVFVALLCLKIVNDGFLQTGVPCEVFVMVAMVDNLHY